MSPKNVAWTMSENNGLCCGKKHALRYIVDRQRKEIETEKYTADTIELENEKCAAEAQKMRNARFYGASGRVYPEAPSRTRPDASVRTLQVGQNRIVCVCFCITARIRVCAFAPPDDSVRVP